MVKAEPPLFTRNFNSQKVRIYFDEFVELKELNNQLIISPPMEEKPEFKIKGRSVQIKFNEELQDSTTYNIFFGNAIVDITENNPSTNFQYVFSTGDILDSLTLKGNVVDAFTLEGVENLNVMLYRNKIDTVPFDSLPYFVKPYFLTKTDAAGNFRFYNLPDESFKLFVLEDGNSNMLFDQISERIAYCDSLVTPYYIPPPPQNDSAVINDSITSDMMLMEQLADSLMMEQIADTSMTESQADSLLQEFDEPDPIQLFLFQEKDTVQRFIKASVLNKSKIMFIFKIPTESHEINLLNLEPNPGLFIEEMNRTQDTLLLWITQEVPDSLTFEISDNNTILDTVDLLLDTRSRRQREKDEEKIIEKLNIKFGQKTQLNTTLKMNFNFPVESYDLSGAILLEDTNAVKFEFHFTDTVRRKGEIFYEWAEETKYSLMIPDSAFVGIGDRSHDTLDFQLSTKSLSDYGNFYLDVILAEESYPHHFLLLQEEKELQKMTLYENSRLEFEYLLPGTYRIKLIFDKNGNGEWDTGDYIESRQPEKVLFFEKEVTIRANWDVEETWDLNE